jgi:hypothetical protein
MQTLVADNFIHNGQGFFNNYDRNARLERLISLYREVLACSAARREFVWRFPKKGRIDGQLIALGPHPESASPHPTHHCPLPPFLT